MDARQEAGCLRWVLRLTDDMWGAAQLLGLFFLGATILCVPPRLGGSEGASYAPAAVQTAARSPSAPASGVASGPAAGSMLQTASVADVTIAPGSGVVAVRAPELQYDAATALGSTGAGLQLIPYSESRAAGRLIDTGLSSSSTAR